MGYSKYKQLEVTQDGPLVTVTLNRPQVRNAVNEALHDELSTVFVELDG